jgi:uncharacterized protein (UPF0335 family)
MMDDLLIDVAEVVLRQKQETYLKKIDRLENRIDTLENAIEEIADLIKILEKPGQI